MYNGTMFSGITNLLIQFVINYALLHNIGISGLTPQGAANILSLIVGA
jgi:thymidine kinase